MYLLYLYLFFITKNDCIFYFFLCFKIFSNLFNFSLFVVLIKKLSIPIAVLELGLTVISLGLIKKIFSNMSYFLR